MIGATTRNLHAAPHPQAHATACATVKPLGVGSGLFWAKSGWARYVEEWRVCTVTHGHIVSLRSEAEPPNAVMGLVSLRSPAHGMITNSLTQREEYPGLVGDSLDLAVHIRGRLYGLPLVGFETLFLHRRFAFQVGFLPTVEHTGD